MKKLLAIIGLFLLSSGAQTALAFQLEVIPDTPVMKDFVLGPGKEDLFLEPGERVTKEITVVNRLGEDMDFKVELEDFSGSYDTEETVKFFGPEKGPYSMKDYIKPDVYEFSLKHGERITIPVTIDIPEDSQPGGLYSSVLVSTNPEDKKTTDNSQQTRIISRLAALYFVRVAGEVREAGSLQDFKVSDTKQGFYEKGPIPFEIYYKNEGSVHLSPFGKITVKNMLGRSVGEMEVKEFFAMPDSLRKVVVQWGGSFMLGRYTASLSLDKGYQATPAEPDTMEISFWVLPWKVLLGAVVALLALLGSAKYVKSKFKFEIRKK